LLLSLLVLGGAAAVIVYGWGWYHLSAGRNALEQYHNESALAHLEQYLHLWPGSVEANLLTARAERRAGRLEDAERSIDRARRSSGSDSADEVALEWALLRAAMGDLQSVEEALLARARKTPAEWPLVWEALCAGYRRRCRVREAVSFLDAWLQADPNNVQAYFLRGEVHRQIGAASRARDEYQRVVELDPAHEEARRHLARFLVQLGRYQDATEQLALLLRKNPDDPDLQTLLAQCHYNLGRPGEAARLLEQVLQGRPDHGPALRERGRIALLERDFAGAEQWLQNARRVLPFDYEVHHCLARALQNLGRTEDAKAEDAVTQQLKNAVERLGEIQRHAMAERPLDAALHTEIGELLLSIGQRESGERWLVSAVNLDPGLRSAHAALARFYEEQGDAQRAAHHRREGEGRRDR
jgi:predicted Zn-dependent protease